MAKILIIATKDRKTAEIESALAEAGFACLISENNEKINEALIGTDVNLALVGVNGSTTLPWIEAVWKQLRETRLKRQLPVVAILSKVALDRLSSDLSIDDFVVEPCDPHELVARVRRLVNRVGEAGSNELINCGDLVIDQSKCEVSIHDNVVSLTFREYELLRFLASHKGRVFTRDALLNQVWGYDYYGGDRTVDVHIRRLRSKIEDLTHVFIETVRNIGYRFKE